MQQFILEHLAEVIFTAFTGFLAGAYRSLSKRIKAQEDERKAVKDGLLPIESQTVDGLAGLFLLVFTGAKGGKLLTLTREKDS